MRANATLRHEKRDFTIIGPLVLAGAPSDSGNYASAGLTYTPLNFLQLTLSTYRENRSGSAYIGTGGYVAKGVSLNATGQF